MHSPTLFAPILLSLTGCPGTGPEIQEILTGCNPDHEDCDDLPPPGQGGPYPSISVGWAAEASDTNVGIARGGSDSWQVSGRLTVDFSYLDLTLIGSTPSLKSYLVTAVAAGTTTVTAASKGRTATQQVVVSDVETIDLIPRRHSKITDDVAWANGSIMVIALSGSQRRLVDVSLEATLGPSNPLSWQELEIHVDQPGQHPLTLRADSFAEQVREVVIVNHVDRIEFEDRSPASPTVCVHGFAGEQEVIAPIEVRVDGGYPSSTNCVEVGFGRDPIKHTLTATMLGHTAKFELVR